MIVIWKTIILGVLKWSWKGTKVGAARVFLFWKGGVWTYVGIAIVPIWDNWEALSAFLGNVSWANLSRLLASIGHNIATSLGELLTAAQQLPSATGTTPTTLFTIQFSVPERMLLIWTIIVGMTTIGWYFRTMHLGIKIFGGENVPPILSFLFGSLVFIVLIWGASGELPIRNFLSARDAILTWLDSVHAGDPPSVNDSIH